MAKINLVGDGESCQFNLADPGFSIDSIQSKYELRDPSKLGVLPTFNFGDPLRSNSSNGFLNGRDVTQVGVVAFGTFAIDSEILPDEENFAEVSFNRNQHPNADTQKILAHGSPGNWGCDTCYQTAL